MLLILQMIVEKDGKVDKLDFAKRLHHWMQHGFQELEDVGGCGWVVTGGLRFLKILQDCPYSFWK